MSEISRIIAERVIGWQIRYTPISHEAYWYDPTNKEEGMDWLVFLAGWVCGLITIPVAKFYINLFGD